MPISTIRSWPRAALALAAAALLAPTIAHAAGPQPKTVPGYYRMMLGDFAVTALSDGTLALPVDKMLTNVKPGQVDRALANYAPPAK